MNRKHRRRVEYGTARTPSSFCVSRDSNPGTCRRSGESEVSVPTLRFKNRHEPVLTASDLRCSNCKREVGFLPFKPKGRATVRCRSCFEFYKTRGEERPVSGDPAG